MTPGEQQEPLGQLERGIHARLEAEIKTLEGRLGGIFDKNSYEAVRLEEIAASLRSVRDELDVR